MRQNFFVTCLATLVSLSLGSDLKSYSATPTPTVIASDAPSAQEPTVLAATDKFPDFRDFFGKKEEVKEYDAKKWKSKYRLVPHDRALSPVNGA